MANKVTLENVDSVFDYHPSLVEQTTRYKAVREAAKGLARAILVSCPDSADRSTALRQVREAMMTANASIATEGV